MEDVSRMLMHTHHVFFQFFRRSGNAATNLFIQRLRNNQLCNSKCLDRKAMVSTTVQSGASRFSPVFKKFFFSEREKCSKFKNMLRLRKGEELLFWSLHRIVVSVQHCLYSYGCTILFLFLFIVTYYYISFLLARLTAK